MSEAEHLSENRRYWNQVASQWVDAGERAWGAEEPYWGIWQKPEHELEMLPKEMAGLEAIELGCGTAYGSAWMARRGAKVTAIDLSNNQLHSARRLATQFGVEISFIEGNAEQVPRPDACFDFALSEYGAAIWCKPDLWIAEAHRLLRPGGQLVFLGMHPLAAVCSPVDGSPAETRLHRSYFEIGVLDWRSVEKDPGGMEFGRSISGWMRIFREVGFEVLDFLELQAPEGARDAFAIPGSWARRFPAEQVWKLRKRG